MYFETLATQHIVNNKKENFTSPETWDTETILILIVYIMWIGFWVATIVNAIKLSKKGGKNSAAALVISVLSWPFYWVFKINDCFGKN